jgi:hypothetical protein
LGFDEGLESLFPPAFLVLSHAVLSYVETKEVEPWRVTLEFFARVHYSGFFCAEGESGL